MVLTKQMLRESWAEQTGESLEAVTVRMRRLSEAELLPNGIGHTLAAADVATFLLGLAAHDLHNHAAEGTKRLSGLPCTSSANTEPSGLEGMNLRDALATALAPPFQLTRLEISYTHDTAVLGVMKSGAETILNFEGAAGDEPRGLRKTAAFPVNAVNRVARQGSSLSPNKKAASRQGSGLLKVSADSPSRGSMSGFDDTDGPSAAQALCSFVFSAGKSVDASALGSPPAGACTSAIRLP